jgi:hypothetical protein
MYVVDVQGCEAEALMNWVLDFLGHSSSLVLGEILERERERERERSERPRDPERDVIP